MRELEIGEDVLGADGSRLGQVERLVVDEGAHRVTHLVVEDRVVPLERFRDAGPDGLATDLDAVSLRKLPRHDESELEPPGEHWEAPAGRQLGEFLAIAGALIGNAPYQPPIHADLVPGEGGHEISEGSPVWSGDRLLGHVVEVRTDDRGELKELVMARQGLRGERVLIPVEKVVESVGVNVHVDLSDTDVELLQPE